MTTNLNQRALNDAQRERDRAIARYQQAYGKWQCGQLTDTELQNAEVNLRNAQAHVDTLLEVPAIFRR